MFFTKGRFLLVLCAALIAAFPTQSTATCTNASIKGVYGVISGGLNGSLQPATGINQVTVDGAGHATGLATKSINGSLVTYTFTGTYHIAANCTGSATWTNQDNQVEHDNLVLNNANNGAFLIQTDANHVQSSVVVAQGTAVCTNAGVKHPYSMNLTGTIISTGQVAIVGQLILNGTGSITGTSTLSLNGTIVKSVPVTGTYTIASNCTGTAKITPKGQSPINLAIVVVNADQEMMVVETDANTIVSGTLQE